MKKEGIENCMDCSRVFYVSKLLNVISNSRCCWHCEIVFLFIHVEINLPNISSYEFVYTNISWGKKYNKRVSEINNISPFFEYILLYLCNILKLIQLNVFCPAVFEMWDKYLLFGINSNLWKWSNVHWLWFDISSVE